nr:FAD binding domain protein [Aspergillus niger CBS 513.88]|eukprot:XP_001397952.2 FAD binding domain protein [Aspergillus niger CBS 513.88]
MTVNGPTTTFQGVVVVGAGPVGLLIALRLAQAGIRVQVLEKNPDLNDAPRASGYFGGALLALKKAGILDKALSLGFAGRGIAWRKPLADDGLGNKHGTDAILYLRQSVLSELIFNEAMRSGLVEVHFNMELVGLENQPDSVVATARGSDGTTRLFRGSFLVGADGGKSAVRKHLGIPFKGHTWPEKLVAIDVLTEGAAPDPQFPTSMIIHPIHFGVITPLEKPQGGEKTLFRCAVALDSKDTRSDEELLSEDSLSSLLGEMMPGPRPLPARVVRSSPYRIHQLCASTFHRGRCILAGDAAHLNNPVGALGLTTGILDAEAAADALELIINEGKQLEALRIYSHARQKAFQTFVNPVSTANKLRIANDPEAATEDWFLRAMLDPTPETIEEFTKPFFGIWRTNMREEMRRRQL